MKNFRSTIIGFATLIVLLTAGAAQSLTGTNTVTSDDIVNDSLIGADIKNESLTSSDIANESLTGADLSNNTVAGADVLNESLRGADVNSESLTGSDVANGSLTGSDVNESTLTLTCPSGMDRVSDVCYGALQTPSGLEGAALQCRDQNLRLPTVAEARLVTQANVGESLWTDTYYTDQGISFGMIVSAFGSNNMINAGSVIDYRCVTTVGARP